jgi:hypothetical protein
MFLHVVGHNQRFRIIGWCFRRSGETISCYFHEELYAVGELHNEMIVPPSTSVHPKILNSQRWYPYFKVSKSQFNTQPYVGPVLVLICSSAMFRTVW